MYCAFIPGKIGKPSNGWIHILGLPLSSTVVTDSDTILLQHKRQQDLRQRFEKRMGLPVKDTAT